MKAQNLHQATLQKPDFGSDEKRDAQFWMLGSFSGGNSWIGKWVGESPWEKHAAGDEFLHVLEGSVDVVVLTAEGKRTTTVSAGSIFVVPQNLWHQQRAAAPVTIVGATPGVTEHLVTEPRFDQ